VVSVDPADADLHAAADIHTPADLHTPADVYAAADVHTPARLLTAADVFLASDVLVPARGRGAEQSRSGGRFGWLRFRRFGFGLGFRRWFRIGLRRLRWLARLGR
jgi:hypothetical protein